VGGALIPFISMGIPGSCAIDHHASIFIMMGIEPGPTLMKNNRLVYCLSGASCSATLA
jgi:TctA family transporter